MQPFFKAYWLTILWALFIFVMCTAKLGSVEQSPIFFPGFDKLVHCGFFFVLVVLWACALIIRQNGLFISYKQFIPLAIIAVVYGGVIELLQKYVFTWRDGAWDDLFADGVGAAMGIFSIFTIFKALNYVKK